MPQPLGTSGGHNGYVAADPFLVSLADLRDHRGSRHVVRQAALAEALEADVDSRVPLGALAEVDVVLEAFDGGLSASGKVRSPWQGECRRCLGEIDGELVVEVREIFRRGGGPEEGTYPMSEDHVNLREMVLDSLFGALPVLPLCSEGCLGICPVCGADRNVSPCECSVVGADPRWSVLDLLREGGARPGE
ncbi:MAG TPA: DUF177 domain-containing protein [Acidimicrobiales bacterium]|nr:DUF177 domain-containing protein [Acidimicrobiales bacterium]